jgi:hypothetical protein
MAGYIPGEASAEGHQKPPSHLQKQPEMSNFYTFYNIYNHLLVLINYYIYVDIINVFYFATQQISI